MNKFEEAKLIGDTPKKRSKSARLAGKPRPVEDIKDKAKLPAAEVMSLAEFAAVEQVAKLKPVNSDESRKLRDEMLDGVLESLANQDDVDMDKIIGIIDHSDLNEERKDQLLVLMAEAGDAGTVDDVDMTQVSAIIEDSNLERLDQVKLITELKDSMDLIITSRE